MNGLRLSILLCAFAFATPVLAARCGGDFNTFIANVSADAQAAGVSQAVISQAFAGITPDGGVLAFDRRQRYTFNKTFEQYGAARRSFAIPRIARVCRHRPGWGPARLRPPPALHPHLNLRAVCRNPRRFGSHQWRTRDAATSRRAAVAHRAEIRRAAADPGRDL